MFPPEIIYSIIDKVDFTTLNSISKINKDSFQYCTNIQFWINKFKQDNFNIYDDPQTVNHYVEQYQLMLKSKLFVEELLAKNPFMIEVRFKRYNYNIIPNILESLIKEKKMRLEKLFGACEPGKITITSKSVHYCLKHSILGLRNSDISTTMSANEIKNFLIDAKFVDLIDKESLLFIITENK